MERGNERDKERKQDGPSSNHKGPIIQKRGRNVCMDEEMEKREEEMGVEDIGAIEEHLEEWMTDSADKQTTELHNPAIQIAEWKVPVQMHSGIVKPPVSHPLMSTTGGHRRVNRKLGARGSGCVWGL